VSGDLPPPELTRMIKARPLPGGPVVIEASAEERAALAGRLTAAIQQPCAISGEDFPVTIDEAIDLRFIEARQRPASEGEEIELKADDCDEIEYAGEMFDLGEAVAQTLGLAIDPYAEGPDADAARKAAGIVQEGEQLGPLADLLGALKKS
jgi:uncharacterized metal-binding protein YceD (DUF177 family)